MSTPSPGRSSAFPAVPLSHAIPVVVGICVGAIELLPDSAAVLAVAGIAALALTVPVPPAVPGSPRLSRLLWVSWAFFAAAVVSSLAAGSLAEGIQGVARFGLFPVTVLALRRVAARDLLLALWAGATIGATTAGLVAMAEVVWGGAQRPAALTNPILFGGLALMLGFVSWVMAPLLAGRVPRAAEMSVVAVGLSVIASLLAQARGSWIAFPVVATLAIVAHVRAGGSRRVLVAVVLVAVTVVPVGLAVNGARGFDAFDRAVDQTSQYLFGDRDDTVRSSSVGARFEMWGSAFSAFEGRPVLGIGWGRLDDHFVVEVAQGVRPMRLTEFDHAHNQFVGALASGGVVGLVTLLAVLVVPGHMFATAFRRAGAPGAIGAAGLGVVAGFAVLAMTEAVFERSSTLVFYAVTVSALLSQLDRLSTPGQLSPALVRREPHRAAEVGEHRAVSAPASTWHLGGRPARSEGFEPPTF